MKGRNDDISEAEWGGNMNDLAGVALLNSVFTRTSINQYNVMAKT
jgi:hypothetical protein